MRGTHSVFFKLKSFKKKLIKKCPADFFFLKNHNVFSTKNHKESVGHRTFDFSGNQKKCPTGIRKYVFFPYKNCLKLPRCRTMSDTFCRKKILNVNYDVTKG